MKSIHRIQRKLYLDRERNQALPNAVIPRSFAGKTLPSFSPSISINFSKYLTERGFISVPRNEYEHLSSDCKTSIKNYNKENSKKVELSHDTKRKITGSDTTPRDVRSKTLFSSLISDTENESTTARNDLFSLIFSTN